jgi:hypothetical protein
VAIPTRGSEQDPDQHGCRHTPGEQRGCRQQTEDSQQRVRIAQVAQGHQRGGMRRNQARVTESDESDEQAHSRRHRRIQLEWNRRDNQLPDAHRGQDQESHSGDEHSAQGCLPGNPHALDNGVGEISVQPHAGRERNRIARHDAHHEAAERRRDAGGRRHRRQRHARFVQDLGIHQHDVSHGDEGRQARQDFRFPIRAEPLELEVSFQPGEDGHLG